jgi:hypothetical protein
MLYSYPKNFRLKSCDIPAVRKVVRIVIALGSKLLFVLNPKVFHLFLCRLSFESFYSYLCC